MSKQVTPRQLEILAALESILARDIRPTFLNLSVEASCCQTYAYQAILSLERKGFVTRTPKKHGTLEIVERS